MVLNSEDDNRLLGRAAKIPDGVRDLQLLHPWQMCEPKKTYRGSKEKELRAPWSSQAVCSLPFPPRNTSDLPAWGPGEQLCLFSVLRELGILQEQLSWLTRLCRHSRARDSSLGVGANSQSLLPLSLLNGKRSEQLNPLL